MKTGSLREPLSVVSSAFFPIAQSASSGRIRVRRPPRRCPTAIRGPGRSLERPARSPATASLHHLVAVLVLVFGISERLRIVSVPCGGLSMRCDRPPEGDDPQSAKPRGIESHAGSERPPRTASSELCTSSSHGPPRVDWIEVGISARSPAGVPIQRQRGLACDAARRARDQRLKSSCRVDAFAVSPQFGGQLPPPGRVSSSGTSSDRTAAASST